MATSPLSSGASADMENILILGGRSEIGVAIAQRLASGNRVLLAARPGPIADAVASVENAGAAAVHTLEFDADDIDSHRQLVDDVEVEFGPVDVAVAAFGILGDQELAERDHRHMTQVLHTDFTAQASLLTVLADTMRQRGRGTIVAFSSVAGVRVRRANYVYGAAKAGLDGFASGLADALHGTGVRLLIARPGFVIGRMTAGMEPAPFSSTPEQVADAVVKEITGGGTRVELWIPWQLRVMFSVAPFIPRALWRRMPR